jgi:hypothetical protein
VHACIFKGRLSIVDLLAHPAFRGFCKRMKLIGEEIADQVLDKRIERQAQRRRQAPCRLGMRRERATKRGALGMALRSTWGFLFPGSSSWSSALSSGSTSCRFSKVELCQGVDGEYPCHLRALTAWARVQPFRMCCYRSAPFWTNSDQASKKKLCCSHASTSAYKRHSRQHVPAMDGCVRPARAYCEVSPRAGHSGYQAHASGRRHARAQESEGT